MRQIDGILYCNGGDWVESCTALVEHRDGRLEILNWAESRRLSLLDHVHTASEDEIGDPTPRPARGEAPGSG